MKQVAFVKGLFNKVKHFSEFHDMINQLELNRKAELEMIEGMRLAYGTEFKRYAQQQKGDLVDDLNNFINVGIEETNTVADNYNALSTLPNDLQPLYDQEAEMFKWREMCQATIDIASKSRAAQLKADQALNKAKITGQPAAIAKAEAALAAAQRKYEADNNSSIDQQESLKKQEMPYAVKFLESYLTPFSAMISLRIKTCEKLIDIADNYMAAAEKIHDYEDQSIERLQNACAQHEKILEEAGKE